MSQIKFRIVDSYDSVAGIACNDVGEIRGSANWVPDNGLPGPHYMLGHWLIDVEGESHDNRASLHYSARWFLINDLTAMVATLGTFCAARLVVLEVPVDG